MFIHGANDNDASWGEVAIPSLTNAFAQYDLPNGARAQIGSIEHFNAQQAAYLHTFNYGNYVKTNLPDNAQSFDHIEWNASVQQG